MNPLAIELNQIIRAHHPEVELMLSPMGQRLFFPKGILAQSAEAKEHAHRFNATIGIATADGGPMHLACAREQLAPDWTPEEVFPYAPAGGVAELRKRWHEHQRTVNPDLANKKTSLPVVCHGLTHGLAIAGDLFLGPDDPVYLPDQLWGNYRLLWGAKGGAQLRSLKLFEPGGDRLALAGWQQQLETAKEDKIAVVLNFPHNPTGYAPTREETARIRDILTAVAEKGKQIVAVCDDAYYGIYHHDECDRQSLFAGLADHHPRIMAIKVDGATKEAFMWGIRVGFITLSVGDGTPELLTALEKKVMGTIRASISNASHIGQSLLLRCLRHKNYKEEGDRWRGVLTERYRAAIAEAHRPDYQDRWRTYPCNAGYFLTLGLKTVEAEPLRHHLLHRYGLGTIACGPRDLRVAFSCVEAADLPEVFALIARGVQEI